LCTNGKNWIKTRMKTPIHLNSKGNEVVVWCLFGVRSCLFLNNHHHCICCRHWCLLHHIGVSQVNNDNIHQNPEAIYGDKDIHLLLGVAREKVGDFPPNMCSIFQNNSCDNISKCVMGYCMLIPTKGIETNGYLDC
jgi:hypothetical protein